jgi:2-polyprenyl-6-hydroxyphenyl methylase/3-demethylubiquinone-9 3-methyltransferase
MLKKKGILIMKKPIDRITQAYFNEFGYEFGKKTRQRIHWLCKQATGEKILDVGCSQGINAILLGREGKQVTGIDILEESIEYANETLAKENKATQDCVAFINDNFLTYDFEPNSYDSIIMGEVLEHISEPIRFINKAYQLLKEKGRLVITVPFGINDYIDHKNTFYTVEVIELINKKFRVIDITYLGKWVGIVTEKGGNKIEKFSYDKDFLFNLEKAFFQVERDLVNKLNKSNSELKKKQKNLDTQQDELTKLRKENDKLKLEIGNLKTHLNAEIDKREKNYEEKLEILIKENKKLKKQSLLKTDAEIQLLTQHKLLLGQYNKLEKDAQKIKGKVEKTNRQNLELKKQVKTYKNNLMKKDTEISQLNKELANITQRYLALKNSKLGKLTIKYWAWKRR